MAAYISTMDFEFNPKEFKNVSHYYNILHPHDFIAARVEPIVRANENDYFPDEVTALEVIPNYKTGKKVNVTT